MKVLICGSGRAVHVQSAYLSAKPNVNVTVLSLIPGEADRLRESIPNEGIRCVNDLGNDVVGKPDAVVGKAEDVPTDLDVVILALPSVTHELYLRALKPYLKTGVAMGAMPGIGSFAFCASQILGSDFIRRSNLFAFETLPWSCHVAEFGKLVKVSKTEKDVGVILSLKDGTSEVRFVNDVIRPLFSGIPAPAPIGNSNTTDISKSFRGPSFFHYGRGAGAPDKLALLKLSIFNKLRSTKTHATREGKLHDMDTNFTCQNFIDVPVRYRHNNRTHPSRRHIDAPQ